MLTKLLQGDTMKNDPVGVCWLPSALLKIKRYCHDG